MGTFSKLCANKSHNAWRSTSPLMINLKALVGSFNVFFKAIKQYKAQKASITSARTGKEMLEDKKYTRSLPEN